MQTHCLVRLDIPSIVGFATVLRSTMLCSGDPECPTAWVSAWRTWIGTCPTCGRSPALLLKHCKVRNLPLPSPQSDTVLRRTRMSRCLSTSQRNCDGHLRRQAEAWLAKDCAWARESPTLNPPKSNTTSLSHIPRYRLRRDAPRRCGMRSNCTTGLNTTSSSGVGPWETSLLTCLQDLKDLTFGASGSS